MMSPLFSVVTATHNRPESLQALIHALSLQTIGTDAFEIIIVPSPHDLSQSLFLDLQKKYQWVRILHPENDPYSGKSASFKRNFGAQNALHPWLAFTDDDCLPDKNWLKSAYEYILANPHLKAIEGLTQIDFRDESSLSSKGLKRLQHQGGYQTCNMFYEKNLFQQLGGFDLNFPYYLEDTDFAWSVLDAGNEIGWCPEAIIVHPAPPGGNPWKLLFLATKSAEHWRLKRKHPELYKKSKLRPVRLGHIVHTASLSVLMYSILMFNPLYVQLSLLLVFILVCLNIYKLFSDVKFQIKEIALVACLIPLASAVTIFSYWRGYFFLRIRKNEI